MDHVCRQNWNILGTKRHTQLFIITLENVQESYKNTYSVYFLTFEHLEGILFHISVRWHLQIFINDVLRMRVIRRGLSQLKRQCLLDTECSQQPGEQARMGLTNNRLSKIIEVRQPHLKPVTTFRS